MEVPAMVQTQSLTELGSKASKVKLASHQVNMSGEVDDNLPESVAEDTDTGEQIHEAAMCGDLGLLEDCLTEGQDIDVTDKAGCTALHLAAKQGNELTAHFLLDNGADARIRNKDGETPLDLVEPGTELAVALLRHMEWLTRMERRYQCTVSLRDGTLVGASPSDRLECWFELETCTVYFHRVKSRKPGGCLGLDWGRGAAVRKAFGAVRLLPGRAGRHSPASRLCSQGIAVPHITGIQVVDALTVRLSFAEEDRLLPSGHEPLLCGGIPEGASLGPADIVSVNLLMCLAMDTSAALLKMLQTHYRDVLQIRSALLLSREMQTYRVPALVSELAAKHSELAQLMKGASAGPESQLHARLLVAEADGLEQELDEVRLSVNSTRAHAVAAARKAVAKLQARAQSLGPVEHHAAGKRGPPLSQVSAAQAAAAAAVCSIVPVLEAYIGIAERAVQEVGESKRSIAAVGEGAAGGDKEEEEEDWPSLEPTSTPVAEDDVDSTAAAATAGFAAHLSEAQRAATEDSEGTPISSQGDMVNFLSMPPLPPKGLSPLGAAQRNAASAMQPERQQQVAPASKMKRKRTLVQRIALAKEDEAATNGRPAVTRDPRPYAGLVNAEGVMVTADIDVFCTDGLQTRSSGSNGDGDKENHSAPAVPSPAKPSHLAAAAPGSGSCQKQKAPAESKPKRGGVLRRSDTSHPKPPAPLSLPNQDRLESPIQMSASPSGSDLAAQQGSRHARRPSRLMRASGSIDMSNSEDLDSIQLSTMSIDKTPSAVRLTRQRPEAVPALNLEAVVPSPISSEEPAAQEAQQVQVLAKVPAALPDSHQHQHPSGKHLTLLELAAAFPENPADSPASLGHSPAVAADVNLSPGPEDGDFAAVRTSVSHIPKFPSMHSPSASPYDMESSPLPSENVFSSLLNLVPAILGCAEPQTTPVAEHGAEGLVPKMASSDSPRVLTFEQNIKAKLGASIDPHQQPGSTALGGLSSPCDDSPGGAGAGVAHHPARVMTMAERRALINERLAQAREKASRLRAATTKNLEGGSSPVPEASNTPPTNGGSGKQRKTAAPQGAGRQLRASRGSRVAEVTRSINLRLSHEGMPAPVPDFGAVRRSSELRKSNTLSCSITRAAASGQDPSVQNWEASLRQPRKAPPGSQKTAIMSYPSRHVSGPTAASYSTHSRISSASSHPGMITVNTGKTPNPTRLAARSGGGTGSGGKKSSSGHKASGPAVTPFGSAIAGTHSSSGGSRHRPRVAVPSDQAGLPRYLQATASSKHHHSPSATTTPLEPKNLAAAPRWLF